MKELEAWLDRRARADQRIPCLDDVFFSGRFAAYARYRLRLFFLRWFTASVLHLARVVLLASAFSHRSFLQLLLAEAMVGFVGSFWWGALELMRERIRILRRQGLMYQIPGVIERWLTAAWMLAAVAVGACAVWLTARPWRFGPFELYAVALFTRLALQFVTRTFHSGAYALQRIYRPGWAVVAVELISFGAVVLVWPIAGAWALPIGTIAAAVAGASITIRFTRRLYHFVGMSPRWMVPRLLRQRWQIGWREIAGAGLSFAVMKFDAILVFGLFDPRSAAPGEVQLFLLFFVMSPTIQAGFDWAHLFYFDLKRLHVAPLAPLLELYRDYMTRLAWLMGVAFWLAASLIGTVVYFRGLGVLYFLLCPFFIARALAASAQIQAFSARRYGLLLATASWWLAVFPLAAQLTSDEGKLVAVSIATAAVYVVLSRLASPAAPQRVAHVGIVEWLQMVATVSVPVRIRSVMLRPLRRRVGEPRATLRAQRWSQREFARTLALKLAGSGAVTLVQPDRVVWFEVASAREIRPHELALLSDGVARSVRETPAFPDGRTAVVAAWRDHGFEAALGPLNLDRAERISSTDLERRFAALFPDGWIFTPGAPASSASAVPTQWRRRIISSAIRFLVELNRPLRRSPLDVTALCINGRLRHVFVAPMHRRSRSQRNWRRTIQRANVLAAFDVVAVTPSPRIAGAPSAVGAGTRALEDMR